MAKKKPILAISYDFDGTLAPGNMQEYYFIPAIKMTPKDFWTATKELTEKHNADPILIYMMYMLEKARNANLPFRKRDLKNYGKSVELFEGVEGWFKRINDYGNKNGLAIEHYIISSGNKEIIEGTTIAKEFQAIYASSFVYDANDVAIWPALAVNYTTKTQFLFRINKGVFNVYDNHTVNSYVRQEDRRVPFERMIFIGDGDTDIPSFRLVKDQGGHSIAVHKPNTKGARKKTDSLVNAGRVNFVAPAIYSDGSEIDKIVKGIIDKIAADIHLISLGNKG